jgi:hypothetical protein
MAFRMVEEVNQHEWSSTGSEQGETRPLGPSGTSSLAHTPSILFPTLLQKLRHEARGVPPVVTAWDWCPATVATSSPWLFPAPSAFLCKTGRRGPERAASCLVTSRSQEGKKETLLSCRLKSILRHSSPAADKPFTSSAEFFLTSQSQCAVGSGLPMSRTYQIISSYRAQCLPAERFPFDYYKSTASGPRAPTAV